MFFFRMNIGINRIDLSTWRFLILQSRSVESVEELFRHECLVNVLQEILSSSTQLEGELFRTHSHSFAIYHYIVRLHVSLEEVTHLVWK